MSSECLIEISYSLHSQHGHYRTVIFYCQVDPQFEKNCALTCIWCLLVRCTSTAETSARVFGETLSWQLKMTPGRKTAFEGHSCGCLTSAHLIERWSPLWGFRKETLKNWTPPRAACRSTELPALPQGLRNAAPQRRHRPGGAASTPCCASAPYSPATWRAAEAASRRAVF